MFDVNPEIIERALEGVWHSETLEHYQEEDVYYSLDLSSEKDARYAINRWLLVGWRNNEKPIYKEGLRYAITKDGYLNADVWLPGIDDIGEDFEQFKNLYKNFLLILWDEWFHEPFVEADLSNYKVRVDNEFIRFPHMPELWKELIYK